MGWWRLRRPLYYGTGRLLPRPAKRAQRGSGTQQFEVDPLALLRARAIWALSEVLARDKDWRPRVAAAVALGQIAAPADGDALKALLGALSDAKQAVQAAAAIGLGLQASPVGQARLRALLGSNAAAEVRGMAAIGLALGQPAPEDAVRLAAITALRQPAPVRHGALLGLGRMTGLPARVALRGVLLDERHATHDRMLAAAGLGRPGGGSADLVTLQRALRGAEQKLAEACILAMGGLDDPATCGILRPLLRAGPSSPARGFAYIALGRQRKPENTQLLLAGLKASPQIAAWAAVALGLQRDETALPLLRRYAERARKSGGAPYHGALLGLGLLGDRSSAVPWVQRALDDRQSRAVRPAAAAAGMLANRALVPSLWSAYDPEAGSGSRVTLVRALAHMTASWDPYMRRLEAELMQASRAADRALVIRALGEIPDYAPVRRLTRLVREDPDAYCRDVACLALGNLLSRDRRRVGQPYRKLAELGFVVHPLLLQESGFLREVRSYVLS